jgi:hypothetical protein
MTEPPHLTDEQVARYRSRTLEPAELLDLDSHISTCDACRDLLYTGVRASTRIATLRADLSGHLDYTGILACASGSATPTQREHLELCDTCRAEVDDLRTFQVELRGMPRASVVTPISRGRSWRLPLTVAAGIALVAMSVWSLRRTRPEPPAVATVQPPTEAPLAAAERRTLDLALADHRLERAPILDHLITRRGTLLGPEAESKRFDLSAPLGTAVETDRPVFRWTALPGATSYVVAIFDENFENVATSPPVTGLEWQPVQPLPRGRVLNWQVTAQVGRDTVHAPVPPAPEAHFAVIPADAAAAIEAARRDHPGNHLLLAALYAKAGALDDAAHELDALDPATAQPYRDSLKRMK